MSKVQIDAYHEYHKLNEIWYLITFEDFPPLPVIKVRDVLEGEIQRGKYGGPKVYAAKKQQCNKKEIRFILSQIPPARNSS